MEDTDLQCGWAKAEMVSVKVPAPFFNFPTPPMDTSKLIRRKKGKKKKMNLYSSEGEEEEEFHESGDRIVRFFKFTSPTFFDLCSITVDVPAQWMFLLASLCLEIVSAVFEQVSSPRKPHFALIAMVLGILALLTCITELFHKATKESVRLVWKSGMLPLFIHPPPRNRLFGTFTDVFGLLGVFFQLAFSIVQYTYLRRHVDNPIKVCFWPFLLIFCVAGSILIRNRRNTEDKH